MTSSPTVNPKEKALEWADAFLDEASSHATTHLLDPAGQVTLDVLRSPVVDGPKPREVVLVLGLNGQPSTLARRRGSLVTVSLPMKGLSVARNAVNALLIRLGSDWRLRPFGEMLVAYDVNDPARMHLVPRTADLDPMTMDAIA